MKKIISLFKRDYEGIRQVYNEIVEGAEWVTDGEGIATEKFDGTCCMVQSGRLYKRYDRKPAKSAKRKAKKNKDHVWKVADFPEAPQDWIAAEDNPNLYTGHWPGWLLVDSSKPSDKWHIEGWRWLFDTASSKGTSLLPLSTYELIGKKVQGNPYNIEGHELWQHGSNILVGSIEPPRDFEGLKQYLKEHEIEGIVWHHPDGRMVKIKRRDFGLEWPVKEDNS